MRLFKQKGCNYKVDLGDPKTYEHLPNTLDEIRDRMFKEIGYYYVYVAHWYRDINFGEQYIRVENMIKTFAENDMNYRYDSTNENIIWYQERVFLFLDEIENMC